MRRQDMIRTMKDRLVPSLLFLVCVIMALPAATVAHAGMDITAYEYQRKFQKTLSLGECPFRQVADNQTVHVQDERCTFVKKGVVRSLPRALSDTMNQLITSSNGVVVNLGLCGGEAASYLGILLNGECIAVEIASRLTFTERTVVRAFVGYYRTSLDILDTPQEDIRDGMKHYYKNKYYVKNRSYGTLEIIFVQFRFWNSSQAEVARTYTQSDPGMSSYMAAIKAKAGEPKSVKIISLSTASKSDYQLQTLTEWNRALRYVQILELTINATRAKIQNNQVDPPHLKYELYPFLPDDVTSTLRAPNPIVWEKSSLMEVQLKQAVNLMKKLSKRCKIIKYTRSEDCQRVRGLRRKLKSQLTEIHKGRSAWMNLTPVEKESFVTRYRSKVDTHVALARRLSKDVRKMIRKDKLEKLERKRNRTDNLNEIPSSVSSTKGQQHRIRHRRRKLRKRKNRKLLRQADKPKPKPKPKPRYRNMGWF